MSMESLLRRFAAIPRLTAATETVATPATEQRLVPPGVATVATVSVTRPGRENDGAAHSGNAASDPDRYCWPHSDAWNGQETHLFLRRVDLFNKRGLAMDAAEDLGERLLLRDRDKDDRRCCLECSFFRSWRCTNSNCWESSSEYSGQFGLMLQRCPGFQPALSTEEEEP